jgi:type II secretory pathway pseudopilin PulG
MRSSVKKSSFTLIEIMFTVGILVILIGGVYIAASKALIASNETKMSAEVKMLAGAVKKYQGRWGTASMPFPKADMYNGPVDFVELLSDVDVNNTEWGNTRPRPMTIDVKLTNMNISDPDYALVGKSGITASDPYDQAYILRVNGNTFSIRSAGRDGLIDTADDVVSQ